MRIDFKEDLHPRGGKGSTQGGRFVSKGGSSEPKTAVKRTSAKQTLQSLKSKAPSSFKALQPKWGMIEDHKERAVAKDALKQWETTHAHVNKALRSADNEGALLSETASRDTPEHVKTVLDAARSLAKEIGFDPSLISIGAQESEDAKFTLNGKQYRAAGLAYVAEGPMKGKIKLFPGQILDAANAKSVVAHEIEHQKFQNVLDKYAAESKLVMADPGPPPDPDAESYPQRRGGTHAFMKPDGSLREAYVQKYPLYSAMQEAFFKHDMMLFAESDGVSDYSYQYWKGWKEGTVKTFNAVHETLAEMARLKHETGKFPEHMGERILSYRGEDKPKPSPKQTAANWRLWRDLFKTVDDLQ